MKLDLLKLIEVLGISASMAVASIIFYALVVTFPQLQLFLSTIYGYFGKFITWFRRAEITSRIEGTVNSFSKDLSRELHCKVLPECKVIWVDQSEPEVVFNDNHAIVYVNLKSDNQSENLFATVFVFIKEALLQSTKPFIRKHRKEAIDLYSTKLALLEQDLQALRYFNKEYERYDEHVKSVFSELEEIDELAFYKTLFVRELHFLGERIQTKTPSEEIKQEIENFCEWVYKLATRNPQEKSNLHFSAKSINVAVVLVADSGMHLRHGIRPYLKRAYSNAGKGVDSIYFISRGEAKAKITKEVIDALILDGDFRLELENPRMQCIDISGQKTIASFYSVKPEQLVIHFNGWKRLDKAYESKEFVDAIIVFLHENEITVNCNGLTLTIKKAKLSATPINSINNYFRLEQGLRLKIEEFDLIKEHIVLSNVGTDTDFPSRYNEEFYDHPATAKIAEIVHENGEEVGLIVKFIAYPGEGFIKKHMALSDIYAQLTTRFHIGSVVNVIPYHYDLSYGRFMCKVDSLVDSAQIVGKYSQKEIIDVVIRERRANCFMCGIEESLLGILFFNKLCADPSSEKYHVGNTLSVAIFEIDKYNCDVFLSETLLIKIRDEAILRINDGAIFGIKVLAIENECAEVVVEGRDWLGIVPAREVCWAYCSSVDKFLSIGQKYRAKLIEYNQAKMRFVFSLKQADHNYYDEFANRHAVKEAVECVVTCVLDDKLILKTINTTGIEGYCYKTEASKYKYVDGNLLASMYKAGDKYTFAIKRFDGKNKTVELSRKMYLNSRISQVPTVGEAYEITLVSSAGQLWGFNNDYEFIIVASKISKKNISTFSRGEIIVVSSSEKGGAFEAQLLQIIC